MPEVPAGWLDDEQWSLVQSAVPVLCVDVLARPAEGDDRVGLILRETPHQGPRWCLVGGRVLMDEPLDAAVRRHMSSSLAVDVEQTATSPLVVEYERSSDARRPHDPRKHAVALTWALRVTGQPDPRGEALDFRWWSVQELPVLGFGQSDVVRGLLAGW